MFAWKADSTPTVVLIHGAFADASSWAGVIPELHADGIDVTAPSTPLRGLATDADYIAGVAERFGGPVLLVGHSYGGAIATVAGSKAKNVVGLVYVNAFALEEGESCDETGENFPDTLFSPSLRSAEFRTGGGDMAIDLYINPEAFPAWFAADLPEDQAAVLALSQRPVAAAALDEKAHAAAWKTMPSWSVVGTADQAIHPDAQRFMADRAGSDTVEVQGSHLALLSQPAAVAEQIRTAARAVRTPAFV